ncbi:MacS family sensor histidine kinase [Actinomadura gamaensis]|uniref:MacS family sensor histidine kinase n=1 Tax=Actinomadura gamaensis TaxID=1763541 RepID=A0ABV9TUW3_9ACTN
MGVGAALWRSVAVYRFLALLYAGVLIAWNQDKYERPYASWIVLTGMVVWTLYAALAYGGGRRQRWPLLAADLAVAVAAVLATAWVETPFGIAQGRPTIPVAWVVAALLAWAVSGGRALGLIAAAAIGAADLVVHLLNRSTPGPVTFGNIVLLFLTGLVVGHVVRMAVDAEVRLARAVEMEASTRERERLARDIHDSVLQVLAMVQRRGAEAGGEAAELGRLAGEQEAALRSLITGAPVPRPRPRIDAAPPGVPNAPAGAAAGEADLRTRLTALASPRVSVATPATPVLLPERVADELTAAVEAALSNVRRHAGEHARAWVLLEDDGTDEVIVSVRDDGPGIPPGRLERAEADGRLGVAQSIRGRVRDLGGTVAIHSVPGEGTELELTVRRPRRV